MTAQGISSSSESEVTPYSVLARVYDRMMSHVNYYQWAKYIMQIVKNQQLEDIHLLDIGCGTGQFLHQMKRFGVSGAGCDPAEAMLNCARQRNPDLQFWHCGLPNLSHIPFRHFNLITSLYDTMNYVLEAFQLIESFHRIYEHLKAPGLFIFDVATEKNCKQYFDNTYEKEIIDDKYAYMRESYYEAAHKIQHNWIKIYTPEGVFVEHHRQKIFPLNQIQNIIENTTQFQLLHVYDEFTFFPVHRNSTRVHFVLKKVVEE